MAAATSSGAGAPALPRVGSRVDGRVRDVTSSGDVLLDLGGGAAALLPGGAALGLVAGDDVSGLKVTGRTEAGAAQMASRRARHGARAGEAEAAAEGEAVGPRTPESSCSATGDCVPG
ncbi:unnamed protein product, partial [Prorocentrum cordatum]